MRVLLVEDDALLGSAVRDHAIAEGHAVDWATRLSEAEDCHAVATYNLILLDLMLPDGRGLEFLKKLRSSQDSTPVSFLQRGTSFRTGSPASMPERTIISSSRSIWRSYRPNGFGHAALCRPAVSIGDDRRCFRLHLADRTATREGKLPRSQPANGPCSTSLSVGVQASFRRVISRSVSTPSTPRSRAIRSRSMSPGCAGRSGQKQS